MHAPRRQLRTSGFGYRGEVLVVTNFAFDALGRAARSGPHLTSSRRSAISTMTGAARSRPELGSREPATPARWDEIRRRSTVTTASYTGGHAASAMPMADCSRSCCQTSSAGPMTCTIRSVDHQVDKLRPWARAAPSPGIDAAAWRCRRSRRVARSRRCLRLATLSPVRTRNSVAVEAARLPRTTTHGCQVREYRRRLASACAVALQSTPRLEPSRPCRS